MEPLRIPAWYYQHHDGDLSRDVPEEAFGGWRLETLEFAPAHTAVVVMHAWDCGTPEQFPGWFRAVPYIPRSYAVCREVFPPLLAAVRDSALPLFHVVTPVNERHYNGLPGYQYAAELAGVEPPAPEQVPSDPVRDRLYAFRQEHAYPGAHNLDDIQRGFERLDFAPEARPRGEEPIAATTQQLYAVCRDHGTNHLIYAGFAINWCLLLSPGGMADMQRHGLMCSAFRQATCAVENKQSARGQLCKEFALWRVALAFGFVFDVEPFIEGLRAWQVPKSPDQ